MTRPRVPDDKRIRIAQACGFCKTRKQKCDGQRPCSLCVRKKNADNCSYDATPRSRTAGPSAKRRLDDLAAVSPPGLPLASSPVKSDSPSGSSLGAPTPLSTAAVTNATSTPAAAYGVGSASGLSPDGYLPPTPNRDAGPPQSLSSSQGDLSSASLAPPVVSWREALLEGVGSWRDVRVPAHLYATERMLGLSLPEGDTTNLLGCSSHLAYLDALRNVLEVTVMPNPLNRPLDTRFRLMELRPSLSLPSATLPIELPGERETYLLVEEFLINTHGLIQVYDEEETLDLTVRRIMADGIRDTRGRVLLYLTIALGRVLAGPKTEAQLSEIDAEAYFQSVETMVDGWAKDLWTVRVLLLKCLYALSVVRRNEGYEHIGRAGWLAQLLGMHREEHLLMRYDDMMKNGRPWSFNPSIGRLRRNVWRTLLVLDRFVAAQLGRPPVVSDDTAFPTPPEDADGDFTSLGATMRGIEILSMILTKIYARPEASALVAADIAVRIPGWPSLDDETGPTKPLGAAPASPGELRQRAMFALFNKLLKLGCVNLLGRPFVLFDAHMMNGSYETHPLAGGGEIFPRNCIESSYRVISLVWDAVTEGYLPRRNPFIINTMFSSALVVISQEISSDAWKSCPDPILRGDGQLPAIQKVMDYFVYSAESDPQAKHLLGLLRYLCSKCKNPVLSRFADVPAEASVSRTGTPIILSGSLAPAAVSSVPEHMQQRQQQLQPQLPLKPPAPPAVYNTAFLSGA